MDVQQLVEGVRDALTVRRVFGEAYERDGVTVIPVASVQGGGGGGHGEPPEGGGGEGGGIGLSARPAGVFTVVGERVRWEPALDINRIILGGQVVAVVALLAARGIVKARQRAQRRR
jgi:uncharacterized spore protein YtfJ